MNRRLPGALVVAALTIAACSSKDDPETGADAPADTAEAASADTAATGADTTADDETADTTADETADTTADDAPADTTADSETADTTADETADTTTDDDGGEQTGQAVGLGEPNPADGDPITVGFVNEGDVPGLDSANPEAAYYATIDYVNEYLGGVNGHPIEVEQCSTANTPAGGTQCGVEMLNAGVDAVLTPVTAQDGAVFTAMADSGIPYVTNQSVTQELILSPDAFIFTNVLGGIASPAALAADLGIEKVVSILIDVPAATGAVSALAPSIFGNAGVEWDLVAVSPQVADMTPQVQQAIGSGAGMLTVGGTDEFNAAALRAITQLGFDGEVQLGGVPSDLVIESVPGGLEGIRIGTSSIDDPSDPDLQLFNAVMDEYAPDNDRAIESRNTFTTILAFVRALEGETDAVDAESIKAALTAMDPVPLPLGGGITFQCGSAPVSFAPAICSSDTLTAVLDENNLGTDYQLLDLSELFVL